jgi:hypothetical protein
MVFQRNKILRYVGLLSLMILCQTILSAQEYYRFRADFSIKEKVIGDAQGTLILGTIYYDKNLRKINHDITFPSREQWLLQDTNIYRIVADTLASKKGVLPIAEASIYNMVLSQQLADFGLAKSGYTLQSAEPSPDGGTISTWTPPDQLKQVLGKIIVKQVNKRIDAVAFYDKDQKIQGKYYFKEYQVIEDLPVPAKMYQILYLADGKEFQRLLEFKNITINQTTDDAKYDFRVPAATGSK